MFTDNRNVIEINKGVFVYMEGQEYNLVSFMDNTVSNENAATLFRYTLIFGGVALVIFFFLSVFLARKIVHPLEESYKNRSSLFQMQVMS